MGNANTHRRHHHPPPPPPPQPRPNQYVVTTPYHYPDPNLPLPYPVIYPPPPNYHRYPCGVAPSTSTPQIEHQKTVTIKNDVNIKKETIKLEEDPDNPGHFLVSFTFDATAPGRITRLYFAKEGEGCDLIPTKDDLMKAETLSFEQGLGQKFRQSSGTGIEFSKFDESELKEGREGVYPLVVKAESYKKSDSDEAELIATGNSQITLSTFEKGKAIYLVKVVKQILWANNTRYELQEIYGIANAVDIGPDGSDSGKECVICLSEPRDTTVLPCRHMCMCRGCAKFLQLQSNKCPICRQPVQRLLEINVNEESNC